MFFLITNKYLIYFQFLVKFIFLKFDPDSKVEQKVKSDVSDKVSVDYEAKLEINLVLLLGVAGYRRGIRKYRSTTNIQECVFYS